MWSCYNSDSYTSANYYPAYCPSDSSDYHNNNYYYDHYWLLSTSKRLNFEFHARVT